MAIKDPSHLPFHSSDPHGPFPEARDGCGKALASVFTVS